MNGSVTNRRDFLKLTLGTTLGYSLVRDAHARRQGATRKPNLLIIQTDEHNFRTLGCYRRTLIPDQALVWGPDAVVEGMFPFAVLVFVRAISSEYPRGVK